MAQKNQTKQAEGRTKKQERDHEQLVEYLSEQLKVEKYDPAKHKRDADAQAFAPGDLAQELRFVPLFKRDNLLYIASADPSDITALDTIQAKTGMDIEPLICSDQALNSLAQEVYGMNFDIKEMLTDMEGEDFAQSDEEERETDINLGSVADMAQEAPVIRMVNSILKQAVRDGASDIHISPEKDRIQLRFRVDGELQEIPAPPKSYFFPLISRLKLLGNMDISVTRAPQDGRFTFRSEGQEVSVRASSLPTIYGENMVLRLLKQSKKPLELADLGLSEMQEKLFREASKKPYGMVLATGPTGSGKSTLLYALLRHVNKPNINIITLEDPVEYRQAGIRQVQLNRKAGMTFASGLRAILRQDPNVIMVGEIRDGETAAIAVESALTGHLVLSTLHTNTAAGAVSRFVEMGVEPFLIASTLLVVGAQRLVRRICRHCMESYEAPVEAMEALGLEPIEGARFLRGKGCYQCNNSGFSGRVGLYEALSITDDVKDLIVKGASTHEIENEAVKRGILRTLKMDAADKVLKGYTTLEEAASAVLV